MFIGAGGRDKCPQQLFSKQVSEQAFLSQGSAAAVSPLCAEKATVGEAITHDRRSKYVSGIADSPALALCFDRFEPLCMRWTLWRALVLPPCLLDLSEPGRRVIHFIDNTSAIAAMAKGYSNMPDSARLVHTFHASQAGARCDVWFEYVRAIQGQPHRRAVEGAEPVAGRVRPGPASSVPPA
eukprot:1041778-Prymnesium_polylepis.1